MYLMHHGSEQIAFTGFTCEQGSAATGVEEEILALCHILEVNLGATIHLGKDAEFMSVGALRNGLEGNVLDVGGKPGMREQLTLRGSGAAGSIAG